jgi:hypothetical protein
MPASALSFRIAVTLAMAGILMGIAMAAMHDHAVMPAHAHLNLLGWVSLFLFGIYYRLNPATDVSRAARLQVIVWTTGTVILALAVAAIHLGYTEAEPIAGMSSLVVLAGMGMFAFLVFKRSVSDRAVGASLAPEE